MMLEQRQCKTRIFFWIFQIYFYDKFPWDRWTSSPVSGKFLLYIFLPPINNSTKWTYWNWYWSVINFGLNIMRNFPETGEQMINTKENSPLRWGIRKIWVFYTASVRASWEEYIKPYLFIKNQFSTFTWSNKGIN